MEKKPPTHARVKQPNSKQCFVCGLENPYGLAVSFYEESDTEVVVEYTVSERYQGYPGTVHGGIVAAILDEVVGRAAMIGRHDDFMVTAKLDLRYRMPVPLEKPLRITGRVERRRGRLAVANAEVRLPDGSVAVEAEALLVDYLDFSGDSSQLQALGWKVYPDPE